jgi:hypothetical protein
MKFKNTKKTPKQVKAEVKRKQKEQEFPNISRFITERFPFKLPKRPKLSKIHYLFSIGLVLVLSLVLVLGITFFGFNFYKNFNKFRQINSQRQKIQSQINFWKSVTTKYDGYKDAYFRIAILEYQLGDYKSAKINNQKALLLDPNYEDARTLQKILISKS